MYEEVNPFLLIGDHCEINAWNNDTCDNIMEIKNVKTKHLKESCL